jgi:APA family basic amino acid/polyamine antiporter
VRQNLSLVRGLGLTAATSINIANMIGTGVFLKARVMTCNVGSPGAVLAVWVLAGMLALAGALTYAELAAMMPKAGGEYVFLREAYGRRWGFLYGWMYLLVSRGGALAAQAVSTAIFLNIAIGGSLERWQLAAVAAVAIGVTTLLNCAAVSATGGVATALTAIKVTVVVAVGATAFLLANGNWANYSLINSGGSCEGVSPSVRGGLSGFSAAMLGALWGYQGWANLTPMVGEVRDPQRNIPRAYLCAMLVVAALYLFANASYFFALTPTEIAGVPLSSSVATEVMSRVLGPATVSLMAMAMMISSLGALHSGIAATARVPFAMAADGLFFEAFGKVSPRTRVPIRGAVLVAIWSVLLALSGSYDKLTDWAIFSLWLFYGLTAASLLVFRRRIPDAERPYRVWGYPTLPVLFLVVTAWLLVSTLLTSPLQTLAGLGLLVIGLPFYRVWSRRPVSESSCAGR